MTTFLRVAAALLALALSPRTSFADWVYSTSVPVPPSALAVDVNGNAYVASGGGLTLSKLDPAGRIVFTTSLSFPGSTTVNAIAVDAAGNSYITGSTESDSFPATPGVLQDRLKPGTCDRGLMKGFPGTPPYATTGPCADAFVTKFDAAGKLVFSTFLGGTGDDAGYAIAVDSSGVVYIAGSTGSDDFPVRNPLQAARNGDTCLIVPPDIYSQYAYFDPCQGFVARITPDGSAIAYATYLPFGIGTQPLRTGLFGIQPMALDSGGRMFFTAGSRVARLNAAGNSLDYAQLSTDSTPIEVTAIVADDSGNVYAAGGTPPSSFAPGDGNAFVAKLGPDFAKPPYFAGFLGNGLPERIAVDAKGRAIVAGVSGAGKIPVRGGAFSACPGPGFVAVITPDGSGLLVSGYSNWSQRAAFAATQDDTVYFAGANAGPIVKIAGIDTLKRPAVIGACVRDNTPFPAGDVGVSPGEVIAIYGSNLGPEQAAAYQLNAAGLIASSLAGTRVTFDGVAAPLLYVQNGQINVVTPYQLAGQSQTLMQVEYGGQKSEPLALGVTAPRAELFPGSDTQSAIVLNENGNLNSCRNPALPGSVITVFTTGAGQTDPPSVDGQTGTDAPQGLKASVKVRIGHVDAEVIHAGPIRGVVTAVQEFRLRIPAVSGNVYMNLSLDGVYAIPDSVAVCVGSQ